MVCDAGRPSPFRLMLTKIRTCLPSLLPFIPGRLQVPGLPRYDGIHQQQTLPGTGGHQDTGDR